MLFLARIIANEPNEFCELSGQPFYTIVLGKGYTRPISHREFRINTISATLMETHPNYEESKIDIKTIVSHMLADIDIVEIYENFEQAIAKDDQDQIKFYANYVQTIENNIVTVLDYIWLKSNREMMDDIAYKALPLLLRGRAFDYNMVLKIMIATHLSNKNMDHIVYLIKKLNEANPSNQQLERAFRIVKLNLTSVRNLKSNSQMKREFIERFDRLRKRQITHMLNLKGLKEFYVLRPQIR